MLFFCKALKKGPEFLAFFCVALCLGACSQGSSNAKDFFQISGPTMGTSYAIKGLFPEGSPSDSSTLNAEVDARLGRFNEVMSTYIENSELSKINAGPQNVWFDISPDLEAVLDISAAVYEKSNGAFDVTVGPLVNLWGFGPHEVNSLPDEQKVSVVKTRVGFEKVLLTEGKLQKSADIYIDLSAVAKGYATDVIANLLEDKGITNYMVEIGGEVRLRGVNQRGKAWVIGVEKPALGREGAMIGVSGDNIAIATSGEYRNYRERDGVRVSHTIDPSTGYPVTHRLASVTLVTEKGGYADAWATAINVLGDEKGYALAESLNLAALFIVKSENGFDVKYTPKFENYMVTL